MSIVQTRRKVLDHLRPDLFGVLPETPIPAKVIQSSDQPEANMRYLTVLEIFSVLLVGAGLSTPAHAQFGRGSLDFGPLESGVLPGGAELPDLTGDTLDPGVEARQPKRAQALPPPEDLYDDNPAPAPVKKRR